MTALLPMQRHLNRIEDSHGSSANPYHQRWRWWYVEIADIMIRDPVATDAQIAKQLSRAASTIQMIRNSDMFRQYFAQRRQQQVEAHDQAIRNRLQKVATNSLDILLDQMETKKSHIPVKMVQELAVSALDRLGFNPKVAAPAVQVNVQQNDNRSVILPPTITAQELLEARAALRAVEAQRLDPSVKPLVEKVEMVEESGSVSPASGASALEPGDTADGP